MLRGTAAAVGGVIAWVLIATIGNLALRISWPDYASVEKAMSFTPAMLFARLVLGALSALGAGFVAAWIAKRNRIALGCFMALLLAIFIPVHYVLWDRFPPWYHILFLASLVVITLLGAMRRDARLGNP